MVISKHFVLFWSWGRKCGSDTSFFQAGNSLHALPCPREEPTAHSVFHPRCCSSHRHLSLPTGMCPGEWKTRSSRKHPWRAQWVGIVMGHLLCWSPYGLSLGHSGVIYGINGIPWDAGFLEALPWLCLPFPHFLIPCCLYSFISASKCGISCCSSHNSLQSLHFPHPDVFTPVTSAPGVWKPGEDPKWMHPAFPSHLQQP